MNRYLIALDLDGTLLKDDKTISPTTKKYLKELEDKGHLIVLTSGRALRSVLEYYKDIGLSTSPVIAYNASSIPEIIGDKTLLLNNLCVEEIHDMFRLLEDKKERKRIIDLGLKNAKKYTWDNMYNQVINLYKKALCL